MDSKYGTIAHLQAYPMGILPGEILENPRRVDHRNGNLDPSGTGVVFDYKGESRWTYFEDFSKLTTVLPSDELGVVR